MMRPGELLKKRAYDHSAELIVAADDAGPAKYLGRVIEAWPGPAFLVVGGNRQFPNGTSRFTEITMETLDRKFSAPQVSRRIIATGTPFGGPPSSTDKALVDLGLRCRVPTVSVIETWNLFSERFSTPDGLLFPDFIIVNDEVARTLADASGLPNEKIFALGNPTFENLALALGQRTMSEEAGKHLRMVLFVSEKIRDSCISAIRDYDEFECLSALRGSLPKGCDLLVKLHPEEEPWKYDFLDGEGVAVTREMSIADMVHLPDRIVGMESTLLYELSIFRNDVISFVPSHRSESMFSSFRELTCVSSLDGLVRALSRPTIRFNGRTDAWHGSTDKIVKFLLGAAS